MKPLLNISSIVVATIMMFTACNNNVSQADHSNWVDSTFRSDTVAAITENTPVEYCFISKTGPNGRDSSFVHFSILKNKTVSGNHAWIPYEKDSRKGTLAGEKRGDTLDVVWTYMQEGMQDTLRTVFLLKNNTLKQKPFSINSRGDRQVTKDNSKFNVTYQKTECLDKAVNKQ